MFPARASICTISYLRAFILRPNFKETLRARYVELTVNNVDSLMALIMYLLIISKTFHGHLQA
jgi:hypothetical protein